MTDMYRLYLMRAVDKFTQDFTVFIKDKWNRSSLIESFFLWIGQSSYGNMKKILFVGGDIDLHVDGIRQALGSKAVISEITEHIPRPSELALLGRDKPGEEIHTFVPNYIRLAEAEAKWIQAQKRSSRKCVQLDEGRLETKVTFRRMVIEDLNQIMIIEHESFTVPWSKEAYYNELTKNEFALYTVAVIEGQVVGFCGMWLVIDEGHITNIAVLPQYRGLKLGEVSIADCH